MITSIQLENFKALKETGQIAIGPITLLVGPNSSGKSSVLQALLAGRATARTAAEGALVLSDGEEFNLGTFPEVVRQSVKPEKLSISLTVRYPTRHLLPGYRASSKFASPTGYTEGSLRTEIRYLRKSRETYVTHLTLRFASATASGVTHYFLNSKPLTPGGRYEWTVTKDGSSEPLAGTPKALRRAQKRFFDIPSYWDLFPLRGTDPTAAENKHPETAFVLGVARRISQNLGHDLAALRHVGAMRAEPARSYQLKGSRFMEVGRTGQRAPDIIFSESKRKKSRDRLMSGLDTALSELGISSHVAARIPSGASSFGIFLDHLRPHIKVNVASVGFGVSQILPILVEIYHAPPGSIILLEQPEIHLHPRAQSRVADLIADAATDPTNRKRFVIETHSEHLIRRLQSLIANPDRRITQEDVRVYFFEAGEDGSAVRPMPLNQDGMFTGEWPAGFFDEAVRLSVEHLEALTKRGAP